MAFWSKLLPRDQGMLLVFISLLRYSTCKQRSQESKPLLSYHIMVCDNSFTIFCPRIKLLGKSGKNCVEGACSMCPRPYVSIALCVNSSMCPGFYVANIMLYRPFVSRVLCVLGSMWPEMNKLTLCVMVPM